MSVSVEAGEASLWRNISGCTWQRKLQCFKTDQNLLFQEANYSYEFISSFFSFF